MALTSHLFWLGLHGGAFGMTRRRPLVSARRRFGASRRATEKDVLCLVACYSWSGLEVLPRT